MAQSRVTEEEHQKMVFLYAKEEKTIRQIQQLTGRGYGTIYRHLTDAGIQLRSRGNRSNKPLRHP
jgi:transposase